MHLMKTKIYFLSAMIFLTGICFTITSHATTHTVQVGNYYFNPASLNVTVGDTVKWVWVNGSHTTTSGSIPAGAASWDHPINSSNQTYAYPVTVAGSYNYVCTPHAGMGMVGSFTAANPGNTLAVTPSNQNVTAASGSTTFSVTSNTAWMASCNMSWCTCTPSGTGNGSLSSDYSENTSTTARVATITITATGVPDVMVTVTQAGAAPTLIVTPASQNVSQAAGSTNFTVSSNSGWTASSDQTWCTVTASGSGNGSITATYQANTSNTPRSAMITVSVSGLPDKMVTVNQDAALGINDPASGTFSIYPNPVTSKVNITDNSLNSSPNEVNIYNINGIKVYGPVVLSFSPASIDVSSLADGVYFIRIGKDKTEKTERMVKTH